MSRDVPVSGLCLPDFYEVEELFKRNMSEGDPSCGDEVGACVSIVIEGETVVDLWGGYKDAARKQLWEKNTIKPLHHSKGETLLQYLEILY